MKVGIGITTFNRPEYFTQCLQAIYANLVEVVDTVYVYNDGSSAIYPLAPVESVIPTYLYASSQNTGVAHAKNYLLKWMIEEGNDYLFLIEDDILVTDPRAITEYIRIGEDYGYEHLMFAHHGEANANGPVYSDGVIEYYPHCVGAYCYYTAHAIAHLAGIEKGKDPYPGLMDENFKNAWEHVEHTKRLGDAGLTSWFGSFADIKGSSDYLAEIPGSIEASSIRPDKNWETKMEEGLAYWEKKIGQKPPVTKVSFTTQ